MIINNIAYVLCLTDNFTRIRLKNSFLILTIVRNMHA